MAYTETPKEKEKRLAYYAKNKADAKAKEDKADAETARKFNETTNTDTSKNTNPMGDTYKKGGKVMKKKTKRYEEGGEIEFETMQGENKNIGADTRARAMAAIAAGGVKDEAPAPKKAAAKTAAKSSSWEDDSKIPALKTNATNRVKANPTYTAPPKMAAADRVKKEREKAASKKTSSYTADHTMGNAMRSGGKVSSASKRADGCAIRGKTRA
jgi:hypothetical protein